MRQTPQTPKFKVGDRVRVVGPGTCLLHPGEFYTVEGLAEGGDPIVTVRSEDGATITWDYNASEFELVGSAQEVEFLRQKLEIIQQLVKEALERTGHSCVVGPSEYQRKSNGRIVKVS